MRIAIAFFVCFFLIQKNGLSATNYCNDANILGCYRFTDGSGTTLTDNSSKGRNMTFSSSGNPAWSTDKPDTNFSAGSALFDSTDTINYGGVFFNSAPATIVAWVKPSNNTARKSVGGPGNTGYGGYYNSLELAGDVAGDPVRFINARGGSYGEVDTTAGFTTNSWQHIAGVWTASNSRTAYLNASNSATNTNDVPFQALADSYIGKRPINTPTYFGDGYITEVAFFNRALSSSEIYEIMTNGLNGAGPAAPAATGGPSIIRNSIIRNAIIGKR